MKLIERELGLEIELKENIVSVVIIENVSLRSSIIKEIYLQSAGEKDGKWLLVENEKSYDLSKEAQVILEPFSLELNSKKMKTKLYLAGYGNFSNKISRYLHISECNSRLCEK